MLPGWQDAGLLLVLAMACTLLPFALSLVARERGEGSQAGEEGVTVRLLERCDALRQPERFAEVLAQHGMGQIMDVVPNHTSSEHPWFRQAVAAGPMRTGWDGRAPPAS